MRDMLLYPEFLRAQYQFSGVMDHKVVIRDTPLPLVRGCEFPHSYLESAAPGAALACPGLDVSNFVTS